MTETNVQLHAIERPLGCRSFSENLGSCLLHAAFSPDGRWLAAAASQRLGVWDLSRHDSGATSPQGAGGVPSFSAQGDLFASTDNRGYRWHLRPASKPGLAPGLEPVGVVEAPGFASLCVVSNRLLLTGQRGSCALPLDDAVTSQPRWNPTVSGLDTGSPDGQWLAIYPSYGWHLDVTNPELRTGCHAHESGKHSRGFVLSFLRRSGRQHAKGCSNLEHFELAGDAPVGFHRASPLARCPDFLAYKRFSHRRSLRRQNLAAIAASSIRRASHRHQRGWPAPGDKCGCAAVAGVGLVGGSEPAKGFAIGLVIFFAFC